MLTKKQKKMLEFLKRFKADKGYSPSVREICEGLGVSSTSTVKSMLDKLEAKGAIRRNPQMARSIEIVDDEGIPVLGKVVAGYPVISEEFILERINFSKYSDGERYFLLRVSGDSMVDRNIHEGDYILVDRKVSVSDGDVGVFRVNDEVTVKTFERRGSEIFLKPENRNYEPIKVKKDDFFEVIGRVVLVLRKV